MLCVNLILPMPRWDLNKYNFFVYFVILGEKIVRSPLSEDKTLPAATLERASTLRTTLIERLADVDEHIGEMYLNDTMPSVDDIRAAIRRQTIANKFVPVCMGSAFKNKGVQLLLDAINFYLPCPLEKVNTAFDLNGGSSGQKEEKKIVLECDVSKPLG